MGLVIEGMKMGLNYGLDKVRFLSPVPVNSEVRIRTECMDVDGTGARWASSQVTGSACEFGK